MLDENTTEVVTATQLFDIYIGSHKMLAVVIFFLFKIRVIENWIKRSDISCVFSMLFIADFCLPLRFINSAILFIF